MERQRLCGREKKSNLFCRDTTRSSATRRESGREGRDGRNLLVTDSRFHPVHFNQIFSISCLCFSSLLSSVFLFPSHPIQMYSIENHFNSVYAASFHQSFFLWMLLQARFYIVSIQPQSSLFLSSVEISFVFIRHFKFELCSPHSLREFLASLAMHQKLVFLLPTVCGALFFSISCLIIFCIILFPILFFSTTMMAVHIHKHRNTSFSNVSSVETGSTHKCPKDS